VQNKSYRITLYDIGAMANRYRYQDRFIGPITNPTAVGRGEKRLGGNGRQLVLDLCADIFGTDEWGGTDGRPDNHHESLLNPVRVKQSCYNAAKSPIVHVNSIDSINCVS
jgi:hypothetical protein